MPEQTLAGCGIVITRPAAQAQALAAMIRTRGGNPILFPLLEIAPLRDYADFEHAITRLGDCNWAVFVSANAVEYGVPRALQHGDWPAQVQCAGIGPTTAAALANLGITNVLTPAQRFDSEGLLALPAMKAMAGKRVIIFRGKGGRELIADTLRARGAEVSYAECYQRCNPQADTGDLPQLWQNKQLQAIVVTSSEVLRNLIDLAGDGNKLPDWLRSTPLYVSHPRIGELAREYGLQAYTASGPSDEAMLQCLLSQARAANHEQTP